MYLAAFLAVFSLRNLVEFLNNKKITANVKGRGKVSLYVLSVFFFVSAIAAAYYLFIDDETNMVLFYLGMILLILSFLARIHTINKLSVNYSNLIESPRYLVTDGVYSVLRHPLFVFYLLEMAAFMLIKFNYISLLSFLIIGAASYYRIIKEEELLVRQFGKTYLDYCRRTKRLIPFVY